MCTAPTTRRATAAPAWGRLYLILLATGATGLGVDAITAAGTTHHLLEALVVVAGFGAMFLWVRTNRLALSLAESCDCAPERLTIRVVESRRERPARPARQVEAPVLVEASR